MVVIFDLDDTLYKEIDYLKSAYNEIALFISIKTQYRLSQSKIYDDLYRSYCNENNPFKSILCKYKIPDCNLCKLINIYRNHKPSIVLDYETENILNYLKKSGFELGLLTDGRSIQQRNKIRALGLEKYFEDILISEEFGSEKPDLKNYSYFVEKYGSETFFYVGDNVNKDFITPNKLGWITIGLLDNGMNIHKQNQLSAVEYNPKYWVKTLKDLITITKNHIL